MTVVLNINLIGVPKRVLLDLAFQACGLSNFDFDITPEQEVAALRQLNSQMKEWPWSLVAYNQPDYGAGLPEEISNVPGDAESAVSDELARRIAPGLNLSLSPEQKAKGAQSKATFVAQYTTVPTSDLRGNTPLGMGKRRWYGWGWGNNYSPMV